MLTNQRIADRAALRPLKQPLYDTGLILTAGIQRIAFFQAPQGTPIAPAGANKSIADTNLQQSTCLGKPNEFDLYGMHLELQIIGDDGENTVQDLRLIYDTSVYQFFFSAQKPWLEVPAQEIPNGAGLEGAFGTADDGAAEDYFFGKNGTGSCKAYYVFTIGKKAIPIGSNESFSAVLSWPAAAINIAGAADVRARNFLRGIFYSGL